MSHGNARKTSLLAIALLFWAALSGCAPLNLRDSLSFWDSHPKPQVPTRTVEFWSEEVLTEPGMPGVRGFAGRVMFYNEKDAKPVAVDGTLTVFAFEDSDRNLGYTAPEKKFIYLPEQLQKYYSKSELGHSYSLWLPWDEVGGLERKLCLVARFEPRKGPPVVSKPCHKLLSGVPPKPGQPGSPVMSLKSTTSPGGVQQASYQMPSPETARGAEAATITIDVPPNFARRTLGAANQRANPQDSGEPRTAQPPGVPATWEPQNQPGGMAATSRTAGAAQDSAASASPSDRYARPRFPARREPAFRSKPDPVRRQPLPATWPSRLPPTPRSDWPGGAPESPPTDESRPP